MSHLPIIVDGFIFEEVALLYELIINAKFRILLVFLFLLELFIVAEAEVLLAHICYD